MKNICIVYLDRKANCNDLHIYKRFISFTPILLHYQFEAKFYHDITNL